MAKKPVVGIVITSVGLFPQITATIANAARSLRNNGVEPIFIVAHNKPLPERIKTAVIGTGERIEILPVTGEGLGNSMIAGFNALAKRADVLAMLPDDFDYEAKNIQKTVEPVLNGKMDFVNSNWQYSDMSFAASFPKPQYLNEMIVSRLITFARQDFHPERKSLMESLNQAEREGKLLQTYTGLLSINAKQWPKVDKAMKTIFRDRTREIDIWAFEQAIMLASIHEGLKVGTATAPRLFEHKWPTEKTIGETRKKRIKQFTVATAIIREYLEKTGQKEKLPIFDNVVKQTIVRIEKARARQNMDAWNKLKRMRKNEKFVRRFASIKK